MNSVNIPMTLKKSTKGTHVYECEGAMIPTVYVRKEGLSSPPPATIYLTVKEKAQ